jgi:hypothetical protein
MCQLLRRAKTTMAAAALAGLSLPLIALNLSCFAWLRLMKSAQMSRVELQSQNQCSAA